MGAFSFFPSPIGIVQVVFFCLLMLLLQHPDGLFQLALGAAALADKGADGLGQVAAKNGIQPLAHGPDAVGAFREGGRVGASESGQGRRR